MSDTKPILLHEIIEKISRMSPEEIAAYLGRYTSVFEGLMRPRLHVDEISIPPKQPSHPPFSATYAYPSGLPYNTRMWATVSDIANSQHYCGELASTAEGE